MMKKPNLYQPTQHLLAFVDTLGFYKEIQKKESQKIEDYLTIFDQFDLPHRL